MYNTVVRNLVTGGLRAKKEGCKSLPFPSPVANLLQRMKQKYVTRDTTNSGPHKDS